MGGTFFYERSPLSPFLGGREALWFSGLRRVTALLFLSLLFLRSLFLSFLFDHSEAADELDRPGPFVSFLF